MDGISVIMPCFKGEKVIEKALERTCKAMKELKRNYEIIVVVDGNLDSSYEIAQKMGRQNPKIRPFTYEQNKGKGHAIKFGSGLVSKELTLFMDSDLDLPPEQIKIFLTFMKKLKTDIIIGSKRHRLTKLDYPLTRRVLSFFYSLLLKALFDLNVTDTQVGFKLMKSEVAKKVMPKVLVKRYAFDVEFLVVAKKMGYTIAEAPVIIMFKGIESTINPKQIGHIFIDTIAIFYRLHVKHYYDE